MCENVYQYKTKMTPQAFLHLLLQLLDAEHGRKLNTALNAIAARNLHFWGKESTHICIVQLADKLWTVNR